MPDRGMRPQDATLVSDVLRLQEEGMNALAGRVHA